MRNNQKASSSKKNYRRAIPHTRTNQKASSSTIVIRWKTNHNALFTNKKTQILRLHMMCQSILTPLKYSNAEERFWTDLTCPLKERAWSLQEKNTIRRFWILYSTIMIITSHHCPLKSSRRSWQIHGSGRKRRQT